MGKKAEAVRLSRELLYEQVAERIRESIRREGLWESFLPSERELAAAYGVSQVTVRRGLETLAAEGLIIRRQGQGTRVVAKPAARRRRSAARVMIAARWTDVTGGYLGQLMAGLNMGAGAADWSVGFRNLAESRGRPALLRALRAGSVGGLILLSVTDRQLAEEVLRLWNGPTVLVDHHFPELPLTSVTDDSRGGARAAVEHLLALGHRRIGYAECLRRAQNPWRHQGYLEALAAAGIEPDGELVVGCAGNAAAGRAAAERMLALPEPPTAVLAFDNYRAWGVWQAAEARGLEVGRGFAVVGFGSDRERGVPESLTSVEVNWREVGRRAAREHEELMAGRARPGRLVLAPGELVVRASSAGTAGK